MANRITINGLDFTGFVEGVDNLVLTYSLDDSLKVVDVAISNDLTFRGEAFNHLRSLFFPVNGDGRNEQADIVIYSDCCGNVFNLKIQSDAVEVCFVTCEMTTAAFEQTNDIIAARKLQELPIFTNPRINPKLPVCVNMSFWGTLLARTVLNISTAIESIATVLTWIGLDSLQDQIDELKAYIAGCRGYANGYYLKDILEDSLGLVGLTLDSTIIETGDYSAAVWIDPSEPINTGGIFTPPTPIAVNNLIGTLTIAEFLELLSIVFNADYRIRNGVLTFERKDFFFNNDREIVNVEQKYNDNKAGSVPCYSYSDEVKYAAGRFIYLKDDIETAGNKAWFEKYRLLESFNEPFNPTFKGLKKIDLPIAPATFSGDQFQESSLDGDRPEGRLVIESGALLERAVPKIIVIKPQDVVGDADFFNALAVNTSTTDYNYPMWLQVSEDVPGELYDNFHSICDSRLNPVFLYELEEFEYLANCAEKQFIIDNRLNVHAITELGKGFPEEIDIEVNTGKITLKNTKIQQV